MGGIVGGGPGSGIDTLITDHVVKTRTDITAHIP